MSYETTVEQQELVMPSGRAASEPDRPVRYGLPCANCSRYYSAELVACPLCECRERVSPMVTPVRGAARL